MILLFGCLRRIVSLVLFVALLLVAWYYRDALRGYWQRFRGGAAPASADTAQARRRAEDKLSLLESASPPARTALSQDELQALLRTRFSGMLPSWVDSAQIRLEGDKVRLSGRVPLDHLPQVKGLGEVAGLLPDTTEVAVSGQVIPLERGRVALAVDQVTAAHIPLPRRLYPQILASLRRNAAGVPADALPLPLPENISSAYVRGDSLILMSTGAPATTGSAASPRAPRAPRRR